MLIYSLCKLPPVFLVPGPEVFLLISSNKTGWLVCGENGERGVSLMLEISKLNKGRNSENIRERESGDDAQSARGLSTMYFILKKNIHTHTPSHNKLLY